MEAGRVVGLCRARVGARGGEEVGLGGGEGVGVRVEAEGEGANVVDTILLHVEDQLAARVLCGVKVDTSAGIGAEEVRLTRVIMSPTGLADVTNHGRSVEGAVREGLVT